MLATKPETEEHEKGKQQWRWNFTRVAADRAPWQPAASF
jgi:hypothetical protein